MIQRTLHLFSVEALDLALLHGSGAGHGLQALLAHDDADVIFIHTQLHQAAHGPDAVFKGAQLIAGLASACHIDGHQGHIVPGCLVGAVIEHLAVKVGRAVVGGLHLEVQHGIDTVGSQNIVLQVEVLAVLLQEAQQVDIAGLVDDEVPVDRRIVAIFLIGHGTHIGDAHQIVLEHIVPVVVIAGVGIHIEHIAGENRHQRIAGLTGCSR